MNCESAPGKSAFFVSQSEMLSVLYDKLWASVMKAVPKLDESESGQMVLK